LGYFRYRSSPKKFVGKEYRSRKTFAVAYKSVGRKISGGREGSNKKRLKNSTIKPLPGEEGQRKKAEK